MFARLAVGEVSPMLLVTLRWLGVTLLLGILCRRSLEREWDVLRPRLGTLFVMGGLGFTAFNALFYVAAYTTTAVNIGIIQGSIPVFVLIGSFLLYRSPIRLFQFAGVVVTIAGVCLVATSGNLERLAGLSIVQGDWFMIIACLLYAGYAVFLRQFKSVSSLNLLCILAAAALLVSLPLTALEHWSGNLQAPTARGWVIVALITLLPSFIAQVCFIRGVAEIGPGRAGIFVNLVPVFASILAVVILGESFQMYHAISLTLVLGGIWLSERRK